ERIDDFLFFFLPLVRRYCKREKSKSWSFLRVFALVWSALFFMVVFVNTRGRWNWTRIMLGWDS
ncbi:hypothetical protein Golax_024207, partial [Gossypium laxum]|nr:hypothetical protein [Gossypium laxum]